MIQSFHSAEKAAGRLRPSGPRDLCPVCGRNVDGDCRFSDDLILCHPGTRFGPPQHLRPGDVIDINGAPWALIRSDAGFDGAAHEFRPDRGGTPKRSATLAAPVARVQELSAKKRLREFNADFREVMKCPALDLLTADEVTHYPELIVCLAEEGEKCTAIRKGKRDLDDLLAEHLQRTGEAPHACLCCQHFKHHPFL